MLLNEINDTGKRNRAAARRSRNCNGSRGLEVRSGASGRLGLGNVRVRAIGGTFPGAGAKCVLDDLVDGAGAAATFGAATEAAIDLPGRARQSRRGADRAADVVIAQNIAGTDDQGSFRMMQLLR